MLRNHAVDNSQEDFTQLTEFDMKIKLCHPITVSNIKLEILFYFLTIYIPTHSCPINCGSLVIFLYCISFKGNFFNKRKQEAEDSESCFKINYISFYGYLCSYSYTNHAHENFKIKPVITWVDNQENL